MIGPFTPGFVADTALAGQLAEIGVMRLMFGVGLHFSLDDLLSVKKIALPGARSPDCRGDCDGGGAGQLVGLESDGRHRVRQVIGAFLLVLAFRYPLNTALTVRRASRRSANSPSSWPAWA